MLGLDQALAGLSSGGTLLAVLGISLLLGLRHAGDPDHLAAVTTLAAGDGARGRRASQLGLAWGLGHGTSLFLLGIPIVCWRAYLPGTVQHGTEAAVGLLIVGLAVWLLARSRRPQRRRIRSGRTAYAIGLLHGTAGSAGVGVLLLAAIPQRSIALAGLVIFACGTALSMTLLSAGVGRTLSARWAARATPYLGGASLAFGLWYTVAALS